MVVQKEIALIVLLGGCASIACSSAPAPNPPAKQVVLMRQLECPTATVTPDRMATCTPDQLQRIEQKIDGDALFTMRIATPLQKRGAVVLMHGAGSGGSASFDLPNTSLMRAIACAGFDVYAFDARGFGGSAMPKEMNEPAAANPPLIRATDAARDLHTVISFARETSAVDRVQLIGWSWGSDVAGTYAGDHPELIERLALLAPVYDRRWPTRHLEQGAWREEKREEVIKFFSDKLEDRAVFDAAVEGMYRFAPIGTVRLPNGPYRDIYGPDAPLWDATKIRASVLIIRGSEDKASLDQHALALFQKLPPNVSKQYLVIGGLGHFLFRERGHAETFGALTRFLQR